MRRWWRRFRFAWRAACRHSEYLTGAESVVLAGRIEQALLQGAEAAWQFGHAITHVDVFVSPFGTFELRWHRKETR